MVEQSMGIDLLKYNIMKEREVEGVLQFTNHPNRKNSKLSLPQSNTKISYPAPIDPFSEKIDIFVRAFEKVCLKLETTLEIQNRKILSIQQNLVNALAPRLDKLISINQKIGEGLQRNGSPTRDKESVILEDRKIYKQSHFERVSSLRESIMSLDKVAGTETDSKTVAMMLPPLSTIDKPVGYQISPIRKKTVSVEEMGDKSKSNQNPMELGFLCNKIIQNTVVAFCSPLVSEASQSQINKWVGNFYNQTAAQYFDLYSKGNISYQDMKIKFSYDIVNETLNLSSRWSEYCRVRQGSSSKQRAIVRRPQFYYMLNEASKKSLQFLINKYPPSRRKIIDTDISEKIKDTSKEFSIVKYDMLSGAKMDIGLDEKQTDFTKEIKLWLNKLVTQTKTQFPIFNEKMRSIFVNPDESIQMYKDTNSGLEFVIGSKISEGTTLFNQEQLQAPGLQLKSTQLLRILMKWCQELSSYFTQQQERTHGNSSGFKTVRGSLPIKIPKSRVDLLVANLKDIYENEIVPCLQIEHNNIGQLVTDLLGLATDGVVNYQFLNQREISILKLSDCLNQSLKAHVLNFLNLMLGKLIQVRSRYQDQKLEANIHLVTFGVMDLLRCRCVGTKSEIYRIYKEILQNQDYFQIIRVKNKLNTPTRDIILNLKIKESFLICQVQLSLGEAEEQVNDHFCHFLYELQRTNFGVIFQCASQISNLDPRMLYVNSHKDIKFKGPVQKKALILQNIHQKPNQFTCQFNHPETVMYSQSNHQPYCCSLCTSFNPGFNLCLSYLRCMVCNTSICPECVMMMGKSHAGFIEKYTSDGSKFQKLLRFFYPQHIYQNVQNSTESLKQISAQLLKFPYVLHMVVDNIGHKPTIYKRYKNTYIQTFSTLKNIQNQTKTTNSFNWNYMIGMKPYERKSIHQLKDYRKYSLNMEWCDLEEILKDKNIQELIVVIDEPSKSTLIVDIFESEDEIESCLIKKKVEKNILEVNRLGLNFLELTSKNLVDISPLNGINRKKNIKVLNLWENKIKNIDLLHEFKEVKELFLRENQVESIEPLLGMKHLEIMVMSSNKIKGSLPILMFPQLSILDISLNDFTDISSISKSDLKSLTFFKLVSTKIKDIPLMNLPKLQTFWFDYNGIFSIVNLSQSSLPKLAKVSGTHNNISGELPELPFPKLQSLILNYNQINSIQRFSRTFSPNLKILSLHHNSLSGALPNLNIATLVKLDLSYNKITSLNFCVFNDNTLPSLQHLDLKFNQISGEVPVMELKALKKLDLSNNLISGIYNLSKSKLPLLQYLDLSKNSIKGALCPLRFQKLRKLVLSINQISDIKSLSDSKLPKLEILKLNNNVIRSCIPKMYFENLKRFDLSSNFVSSEEFLKHIHLLPSLEKVFLINNPPALRNSLYGLDVRLQSLIIFNEEYNE